jgi:hypothetical protein
MMALQLDSVLVEERAVWPAYLADDTLRRRSLPAKPKGGLELLLSRFLRRGIPTQPPDASAGTSAEQKVDEDISTLAEAKVTVLLPPPPSISGLATLFLDNPEVNERSRRALTQYRAEYQELDNFPYPLRLRKARHTGLPAFLNGYLEASEVPYIPEDPDGVAERWLFKDLRAEALFGASPKEVPQPFEFSRIVQIQKGEDKTGLLLHVRYQQRHGEWPVFGGGVAVHLATEDPRASVTSSYFPVRADLSWSAEIDEAQAIALAQQALAGYFDGPEAIGLYWYILSPWLQVSGPEEPPHVSWGTIEAHVAEKQIYALDTFSQSHDHIFPEIEQVVGLGELPNTQEELLALLHPTWEKWPQYSLGEWKVEVAPFGGSKLFIFPFAGQYHLAYQVEFLSPTTDQAWRVFVDAQSGAVLGQPESLLTHVPLTHYRTSQDALGNSLANVPLGGADLDTRLQDFMTLKFHEHQGGANITLTSLEGRTAPPLTPIEQEAVNIAFHACKMYDHFSDMVADAAVLQSYSYTNEDGTTDRQDPGLEVAVGRGDSVLNIVFNDAWALHPKRINFQTDSGGGLDSEGKTVFGPSLDPELVYHEMTHGLMWLLNRKPFELQDSSVPFGVAMVEGYANYFARSLAAREDPDSPLWARATFRVEQWGNRWSFSRLPLEPGADFLPAPNLYPSNQTSGLAVYDVGMVWARALWEIRGLDAVGADLADKLACDAFNYVHGWVTNFELAAEGVIDQAPKRGLTDAAVEAITSIFAQRRILAERGVQALALANTGELLVGTDAGLSISNDNGDTWNSEPLGGSGTAQGVVALSSEGSIVYAATEEAVYKRNFSAAGGGWLAQGSWPAERTPLCMLVVDDTPYVGTGQGVWQFSGGSWQEWGLDPQDLDALALQMADMLVPNSLNSDVRNRYAVMVAGAKFREDGWAWEQRQQIDDALTTAIAARDNTVFVGTLNNGIWRQMGISYNGGTSMQNWSTVPDSHVYWEQFVAPAGIGNSAVLCLVVDGTRLLAGTTSGLYKIDNSGMSLPIAGGWPPSAMVLSILPVGGLLLIGTATHGLWREVSPNSWMQVPGIGV